MSTLRDLVPGELVAVQPLGNIWRVLEVRVNAARVECLTNAQPGVGFWVGARTNFVRDACCPALPLLYRHLKHPFFRDAV